MNFISLCRADGKAPDHLDDPKESFFLSSYLAALKACNAVDFGCFVDRASELLRDNEDVATRVRDRYRYVIVDEFQDTSQNQLDFLGLLAREGKLTCVGDDDQSIFSFGGATPAIFDRLRVMFSRLREHHLVQNYRSTRKLVRSTAALVKHNRIRTAKAPFTTNAEGDRIRLWQCRNESHQAQHIAAEIADRLKEREEGVAVAEEEPPPPPPLPPPVNVAAVNVDDDAYEPSRVIKRRHAAEGVRGSSPPRSRLTGNEIAVLYRQKKTGRALQRAFLQAGIAFNKRGTMLWRRRCTRDLVAVFQLSSSEANSKAGERALKV